MKVAEMEEGFIAATASGKREVLLSLTSIAAAHRNSIDLKPIGRKGSSGQMKITFSKELSTNGILFVDSSVTGMFERRCRLGL